MMFKLCIRIPAQFLILEIKRIPTAYSLKNIWMSNDEWSWMITGWIAYVDTTVNQQWQFIAAQIAAKISSVSSIHAEILLWFQAVMFRK